MSLLQFILIIAAVVFLLFGRDLFKRKKATILHYIVFIGGGGLIIAFVLNNDLLNAVGRVFGIARGADLLVYISIVVLFYFYIEVLNKHTKDKQQLTKFISKFAVNQCYKENKEKISKYKNNTEKDKFGFAIRVYNEDKEIGQTIDEVVKAGFHKILCINDGSSDKSVDIIEKKQKEHSQSLILLASHQTNRGGGAANQSAYGYYQKYAEEMKIEWITTLDADRQMNIKDMKTFMETIEKDKKNKNVADIYLGSRFINGGEAKNITTMRKKILWLSRIVTRRLYGVKVSDPHNGYRVIHKNAIKKFSITADGMHYANEINEQIQSQKMNYKEVPVHIRYTEYSMQKGQKNSNSILLGMEMIYKKLFFR